MSLEHIRRRMDKQQARIVRALLDSDPRVPTLWPHGHDPAQMRWAKRVLADKRAWVERKRQAGRRPEGRWWRRLLKRWLPG